MTFLIFKDFACSDGFFSGDGEEMSLSRVSSKLTTISSATGTSSKSGKSAVEDSDVEEGSGIKSASFGLSIATGELELLADFEVLLFGVSGADFLAADLVTGGEGLAAEEANFDETLDVGVRLNLIKSGQVER